MAGADLLFRNVDADVESAVETWPVEAIATALERGSLTHWSRIAAAIAADPWGSTARAVEQALRCSQPYGVAAGMARVIAGARSSRESEERQIVASELRELIDRSA